MQTQPAPAPGPETQAVPRHLRALAPAEAPAAQEADARRARRQDRAPRGRRALPLGRHRPNSGFDCSGLVYWAYGRLGIALPHSSYALAGKGRPVRSSRLGPATCSSSTASATSACTSATDGWCTPRMPASASRSSGSPPPGRQRTRRRAPPALTAQLLGSSSTILSRATTGGSSVFDSIDLASASSCSMISSEWVGSWWNRTSRRAPTASAYATAVFDARSTPAEPSVVLLREVLGVVEQ